LEFVAVADIGAFPQKTYLNEFNDLLIHPAVRVVSICLAVHCKMNQLESEKQHYPG